MAEQIQWLEGQAKDSRSVEKICPKRHITQNQWQSEWNEMYLNDWSDHRYDFISDYECIFKHPVDTSKYFYRGELWDNLQETKQQGTRISIVNIVHFTELTSAKGIVKSGGLRGRKKKINENAQGCDVKAKFSWWIPIFGEDDIKLVRDTLGVAIQPFLAEQSDQFYGDGSDQADEIDSDQDTETGGDQDNEEGSDQYDEIDQELSCEQNDEKDDDYPPVDQDDEIDSDQDTENGGDQDDEIDSDQDTENGGDHLTQLQKQFASSDAFKPKAQRYGSFYFQYDINDLCDFYRIHFDGDHEVQFKVLGTFSYKKEVMHAVLICSQEYGNGFFNEYPPVLTPEEDINNEAVVTRDNEGNWVWKPQATGTEIKRLRDQTTCYPNFRRWEHVAFAFHIPEEWGKKAVISVPDLRLNLHYLLS